MDSAGHIRDVKRAGWKSVVRVKEMGRDVFGDGLSIDESLGAVAFRTAHLRSAKGFKKVLKHLSDNLAAVSMKTHALLAGIRALVNEPKLRFISGRPPKAALESPMQMLLAL